MIRYALISAIIMSLLPAQAPVIGQDQGTSQPVVIQRQLLRLTSPEIYRNEIMLRPARQLTLTAPFEGQVQLVSVQPGKRVRLQAEMVRLENKRLELTHNRALAALRVATSTLAIAQTSRKPEQITLGEAQVDLAKSDLELANYDKTQASIRATYAATVLKVHVQDGQTVRKGDPLVTIADLTVLECRIPVDRKVVKPGKAIQLTVEDTVVEGQVQVLEPLQGDQIKLRDLAVSVAIAVVSIPNGDGELSRGQAVYPAIVPKNPVTKTPLKSVRTNARGIRIVQVLRDHIVRNIPVLLHGQIGKNDVLVSGPFLENDHVITSTSVTLSDLTIVRHSIIQAPKQTAGTAATKNVAGSRQSTTKPPVRKTGSSSAGF